MRKDLVAIMNNALGEGLAVVLSTNGLIWKKEELERVANNVRVHVSMDSGFPEIHNSSRKSNSRDPSSSKFETTSEFIRTCLDLKLSLRVMTCLGSHNQNNLFMLGEHLADLGVAEWNLSRILNAGRAISLSADTKKVDESKLFDQVQELRETFHWMRIRFSNRFDTNSYFLLVLPDGTLATQLVQGEDKVPLGNAATITLPELKRSGFDLHEHSKKWIAARLDLDAFSIN